MEITWHVKRLSRVRNISQQFKKAYGKLNLVMLAITEKIGITGGNTMNKPSAELLKVANFFIAKSNEANMVLTNKKLQKLAYYAQAWNLVINDNQKLYSDPIEAWVHGPAIKSLYSVYKKYGFTAIIEKPITPVFTQKQAIVLEEVWRAYGKFDADYLEALSHSEAPWLEARGSLESNDNSTAIIDTVTMKNFYSSLLPKSNG